MEQIPMKFKTKIFSDGADLQAMIDMASKPFISGLTTNPTLMKKAGITDYMLFAKEVIREIPSKPISFEVFSDDLEIMKSQALKIASWGDNVFVKVPITNTKGQSTNSVISFLSSQGVKVNVTALMTVAQVESTMNVLSRVTPSYVSVFAGRIADTGRDPIPVMQECLEIISENDNTELIWASPRELLNVIQANEIGCHVITATSDILSKLHLIGKSLNQYSLETVEMFYEDALSSGFEI